MQPSSQSMPAAHEPWRKLLEGKERQSLRYVLLVRVLVLAIFSVMNLQVEQALLSRSVLATSLATCILVNIVLFFLVRRGLRTAVAGIIGAVLDVVLLISAQILWYVASGGPGKLSPAFMDKTALPIIALLLFALNTVMLRWQYVAVACSGFVVYWSAQLLYMLSFPDLKISKDFIQVHMHGAVHPGNYVQNLVIIAFSGVVLMIVAARSRRIAIEASRFERSNAVISRYFSPGVAEHLAAAEVLEPGGRKQDVAVLFSDIRGFTQLSEQLEAEAVVALLSDYHARMLEQIFRYGGSLDKFIGDGIMAEFGIPTPTATAATDAVLAGAAMQRALIVLNGERQAQGLVPLAIGIGIHFGEAVVGNVGTTERLEFTVIGDTVNTASRLESACKEIGKPFLISNAVYEQLDQERTMAERIVIEPAGQIAVRGKSQPVTIWEVRAP